MRTVEVNAESNGYAAPPRPDAKTRAHDAAKRVKSRPDILAGRVILTGAGVVVGLVILANVAPYSKLANTAIATTLGLNLPWLGRLVGICGLAAVQVGEIFPYTMHRPNRVAYANTGAIATLAYGIDAAIAIWAWPPLRVGIGEFVAVPLMSSINWANCLVILILLFGVESFIRLCRLVTRSNRSQD
jgi:hypothetical protein